MTLLLVMKSQLKNFYEKHCRIIRILLKLILVFCALTIITRQMDYGFFVENIWVVIILSAFCAVMPDLLAVGTVLLVICGEISRVSLLMAAAFLMVMVIYFLLFARLEKRQSFLILSIPLLSALHMSYVVPVAAALFVSPVMLPAVIMGILLQYMMGSVAEYAALAARTADPGSAVGSFRFMADYLIDNREMFVMMSAFCLAFLCTYLIRSRKMRYSSQIGILVGFIVLLAVELLSNIMLDLNLDLGGLTLQIAISAAVAYVIQFFRITLDYHGTRKLQFEDDEYYYYVTAVPKYKVAVVDKTLTRIVPNVGEDTLDLKEELEKALQEEAEETVDRK